MNIMLDVNIVLDMLQERHPHYQYSSIVVNEVLSQHIQGSLSGHGITTIYGLADVATCDYIVTRNKPDFEHSPVSAITPEDFVKRYVFTRQQENFQ